MALLIVKLDKIIGNAQAWRDTFREQIPDLPIRIWPDVGEVKDIDCLAFMRERSHTVIEATRDAEEKWVAHVNEVAQATLYPQANSWYMGANIPGKPRIFMPYIGGVGVYRQICNDVAAKGYEGFAMGRREQPRQMAAS